jgi:uncharacterized membrane protein YfhO
VDGAPAQALLVDDVLRGVVVGPGSHRIVWSYAVPGLRLGIALTIVALLVGGGGVAVLVARRRRLSTGHAGLRVRETDPSAV